MESRDPRYPRSLSRARTLLEDSFRAVPRLAKNVTIAASTSARSVALDPTTFAVQVARRFPAARRALVTLAGAGRGFDGELARTWLRGDLVATRALLRSEAKAGLGRFAAEVAQAAGLPELIVDDPRVAVTARARAAWQLGDIRLALELLDASTSRSALALHRSLSSELALLEPGKRLAWRPPLTDAAFEPAPQRTLILLTNSLPHTQSGYTLRSHAVLTAQRGAGLAPTAMTRVGYPVVVGGLFAAAEDEIDGIRYVRALPARLAGTPGGRLAQQASEFAALVRRTAPALLQTTSHYPNALVVREVAEAFELPWTYEVRGMLEQTWLATLGSAEARERAAASERYRLTREREAELATAADGVFTLAERMADDLTARGVPRERITLVPNAVPASLLRRERVRAVDARAALELDRDGFWVGSISSLVDYEGFDVLLEAVALARRRGIDARALLVGDGVARAALVRQAASLGIADAVTMPGRVPRGEAERWRDCLDVMAVPRLDLDVTRTVAPLKPVEALAAGIPLLVSDLQPLVEIVGPELADRASVPAGDAGAWAARITELSGDQPALDAMASAGRSRATSLTWEAVGATYRTQFDRITEGRGPGGA